MKTQLQIKSIYIIAVFLLALLSVHSLSAQDKQYRINKMITEEYNTSSLSFESKADYKFIYSNGSNSDDYAHNISGLNIKNIDFDTVLIYNYKNSQRSLAGKMYKNYYPDQSVKSLTFADNIRHIYTYLSNGKLESKTLQTWNSLDAIWLNNSRRMLSYSNNNLSENIKFNWDSDSNKWSKRLRNLYTYNSNGNLSIDRVEDWHNNQWDSYFSSSIKTYHYSSSNIPLYAFIERWEYNTDTFHLDIKYSYTYNSGNNYYTMVLVQKYDSTSSNWINDMKQEYTFTSFGKIKIQTSYRWDGTLWQPTARIIHEYEEYSAVGLNEIERNQLKAIGFPNPSTDEFNIKFENPESAEIELEIFDATGRKISRKDYGRMQKGKVKLSWSAKDSGANSGIYFYKLISGKHFSTGQFIVR